MRPQSGPKKLAISGKRVNEADFYYRTDHTKVLEVSLGEKIFENFCIGWPESWFAFCQFSAKPWGGSLNFKIDLFLNNRESTVHAVASCRLIAQLWSGLIIFHAHPSSQARKNARRHVSKFCILIAASKTHKKSGMSKMTRKNEKINEQLSECAFFGLSL